jgi:uncharacterized protein with PQ loop repeat
MDPASDPSHVAQLIQYLGWIPALVFPSATAVQLVAIIRSRSSEGVSVVAWTMFAVANISLWIYTEKHDELASILATLGSAALNICIVVAAIRYRKAPDGNTKDAARVG